MAIYIKGVELPTNCLTCPFTEKDDRLGTVCYFTNIAALNIGRQEDCPLVYIPESHGRLIDADKLADDLEYDALHYDEDHEMKLNCASWLRSNATPTVIEGSE